MTPTLEEQRKMHFEALENPRGPEVPVVFIFRGLTRLPGIFLAIHRMKLGDDAVLSEGWRKVAEGLFFILNGDIGDRLDRKLLDDRLKELAAEHKIRMDEE